MKKFLNIFFVVLGVIFFILLIVGTYLFVADPYNIKPLIFGSPSSNSDSTATTDKNPNLNATQEKALETFGVDPANVPSSFTPEQQVCFVSILGEARVNEIIKGATPTATEYLSVRSCL
jgi:hypothetical protein